MDRDATIASLLDLLDPPSDHLDRPETFRGGCGSSCELPRPVKNGKMSEFEASTVRSAATILARLGHKALAEQVRKTSSVTSRGHGPA